MEAEGKTKEKHRKTIGKTIGKPLEATRKPMDNRKPWEIALKPKENHRGNNRKSIVNNWNSHEKPEGNRWKP